MATNPLKANEALYKPIEIKSQDDYGPVQFGFGTQQLDDNNCPVYNDNGQPVRDPYDLTGYTFQATISQTAPGTGSVDFSIDSSIELISGGNIQLSLTDVQTAELANWKITTQPTEKIGEYRIVLINSHSQKKTKVYGPVSINVGGL